MHHTKAARLDTADARTAATKRPERIGYLSQIRSQLRRERMPGTLELSPLPPGVTLAGGIYHPEGAATMTDADRKDAFDLIQQLRGNLMERDAITPADLTPAARRAVETRNQRLVILPAVAIENALDQLSRLNALVALA